MTIRDNDLNDEKRQQVRDMEVESLAKFVFRYLNNILDHNPHNPGRASVERLIRDLFPEENYPPPSNYPNASC